MLSPGVDRVGDTYDETSASASFGATAPRADRSEHGSIHVYRTLLRDPRDATLPWHPFSPLVVATFTP